MSIDAFLGHSNRGTGRQKVMSDWTDSDDHSITVWLHRAAPILALWRHGWKKLVVREDREKPGTTLRNIWMDRLVCYEDEEVLKAQHFRDRNTGARDVPPVVCPHCLMIEHVYGEVRASRMSWLEPLFRFTGADDARQNCVFHAGGLFNAFGNKKLTDAQKKDMASVAPERGGPLFPRDAWTQSQLAKLEYALTVVDDAHPENGVQVTVESNLLGQRVQDVIRKSIKELGVEDGNPARNPYAIQWDYDPRENIPFQDKYDATRMSKIALRTKVAELLSSPPPSIEQLAKRFNLEEHRANLERHALVQLPWDKFFAPARALAGKVQEQVPDDVDRTTSAPAAAAAPPADEFFACDGAGCDAVLKATDPKCPKCGFVYVVEEAAPPPKPALPKRSTAKGSPPTSANNAPAHPAPPPAEAASSSSPFGDDDDLPFIRNTLLGVGSSELWGNRSPVWVAGGRFR